MVDDASQPGTVEVTIDQHVALVILSNERYRNAFTIEMVKEFTRLTEELDEDPEIWVIVITGAGSRAFCAGGDVKTVLPAAIEARDDILNPIASRRFLSNVFTPVIAAVEGACLGGGFEILLGTDIRVAGESAFFGFPETYFGFIAGSGASVRLPRQIPWAIAMELLLQTSTLSAERALSLGLINQVVPDGSSREQALELAQRLSHHGPVAMRAAKEIAVRSVRLEEGFVIEHDVNRRVLSSEDAREGVESLREKRSAKFMGR